jgi:FSR family fosmidomycin resistance protein-like MFS transporter
MTPQKGLLSTMKSVFAVIYPIWAMSTVRDAASQGVRMFLPIRIASEGGDIAFVGTVLFLIMLGSTIAMLVIGRMADRFGKKKTLTAIMAVSSLFLFAGRASGGWTAILFFVLGTAAVNATMPITAAIAQEMVPNSRGMASSIVMGLSWGMGNMLMAPFGKVGDLYGVNATLFIVALLPLLTLPLILTRPFREAKS